MDLGTTYMNDVACKTFIYFIAEAERQQLGDILAKAEFFSLLWMVLLTRVAVLMKWLW